ncbi:hypothetical protein Zmor_025785 [Zophobas morio]|uniref:Uncharacterized protein n=1 Tax=Zophobas morio TaxID=2755281 RepID=A0AA38HUT9_9CUCU|nr:hypothetical protein Zmor_025785 [Zophobas morio]
MHRTRARRPTLFERLLLESVLLPRTMEGAAKFSRRGEERRPGCRCVAFENKVVENLGKLVCVDNENIFRSESQGLQNVKRSMGFSYRNVHPICDPFVFC